MKIYYRLSDKNRKGKAPSYFNNKNCLDNFLKKFTHTKDEILLICDNIEIETEEWIKSYNLNYIKTNLGNCGSFDFSLKHSIQNISNDDEIVYFVENDYLHRSNSRTVLEEGFNILNVDYISLYDGPEKYCNHFNINYERFVNFNETGFENFKSKIYFSPNTYWRTSNCTTMTFAAKVKTLKSDYDIIKSNLINLRSENFEYKTIPSDYQMFCCLSDISNKILINPIPGYCTHGDLLSPYIKWEEHL
jgi:hypothetical protein